MLSELRERDYDRYLALLFAPARAQGSLAALYAFHHEISKTAESVSQPMTGLIRLQWWRDAVTELYVGQVRAHAAVQALAATVKAHGLPRDALIAMIDAREQDLEETPFANKDALLSYCDATAGQLMRLCLRVLGAGDAYDGAVHDAARA